MTRAASEMTLGANRTPMGPLPDAPMGQPDALAWERALANVLGMTSFLESLGPDRALSRFRVEPEASEAR